MAKERPKLDPKTYVTLLPWMVEDLGLSGLDLIVYAIIYGYSQGKQGVYYGTLQYLSCWTNATENGIKKSLKSLIDKGLIKKVKVKYNRYFYSAEVPEMMSNSVAHHEQLSCPSMSNSVAHHEQLSCSNNNNNTYINNNYMDKDPQKKKGKKAKNQFNNFSQRDNYDYGALEKKMTGGV